MTAIQRAQYQDRAPSSPKWNTAINIINFTGAVLSVEDWEEQKAEVIVDWVFHMVDDLIVWFCYRLGTDRAECGCVDLGETLGDLGSRGGAELLWAFCGSSVPILITHLKGSAEVGV